MANGSHSTNVVPFNNSSFSAHKATYDSVTLESWLKIRHSEDDLREVFLNIDRAMKYVHDHGYCIKSFHPKEIEIINEQLDQIRFNTLLEMPFDQAVRKQYIKEDIYNSSFLQIGIYTKCLYYLNRDYLNTTLPPSISLDLSNQHVKFNTL